MPKCSGIELVRMLRTVRMTLPVVLTSSTTPAEALRGNASLRLAATLVKPFFANELLETVKQVLHAADGAPNDARANFAAMNGAASQTESLRTRALTNAPTTSG
jgi:DNA-binding NtrC family response regulator